MHDQRCSKTRSIHLCIRVLVGLASLFAVDKTIGQKYHKRITVDGPTELDWTFAVARKSEHSSSPNWHDHTYDSKNQSYEFYGPKDKTFRQSVDPAEPFPLILFISNKKKANGWKHWSTVCRQQGFLYAGPHGTYKGAPDSRSIRIVLDVLHDIREKHPIDPERTYIVGFHGGARIAATIAYRLPELVGGVIPISQGTIPPDEPWLLQRISNRLSVAHLTASFGHGVPAHRIQLVKNIYHPQVASTGTRSKLWRFPGDIQAMPNPALLREVIQWLDDGAVQRRALASELPSTSNRVALSRSDQAQLVMNDAKNLLLEKETTFDGLLMLRGIQQRWPDLPVATEARKRLNELKNRDGPWRKEMERVTQEMLDKKVARLRPKLEIDPPRWNVDKPKNLLTIDRWIAKEAAAKLPSTEYNATGQTILSQLGNRKTLDEQGRVVAIDLSKSRVTAAQLGQLKRHLLGLQSLRGIDFASATMNESSLIQLSDLTELQAIRLPNVNLTNRGMALLGRLKKLRFLSIENSRVTTAGLQKIGRFAEMQALILGRTSVDDRIVSMLAENAHRLEILNLSSTQVTNQCADDISVLTTLTHLNLSNTKIGDTTCRRLGNLKNLKSLILDDTRVTDRGLKHLADLPNLVRLSLLRTKVSDRSIPSIQRLSKLEKINLRRTLVTDPAITEWISNAPHLQIKWDGNRLIGIEEQKRLLLSEFQRTAATE